MYGERESLRQGSVQSSCLCCLKKLFGGMDQLSCLKGGNLKFGSEKPEENEKFYRWKSKDQSWGNLGEG